MRTYMYAYTEQDREQMERIYAYELDFTDMFVYLSTNLSLYPFLCLDMYVRLCAWMDVCMYVCMYVCMNVYMYVSIYIHTDV